MYFYICYKYTAVLVISLILFRVVRSLLSLLWKIVCETELKKRFLISTSSELILFFIAENIISILDESKKRKTFQWTIKTWYMYYQYCQIKIFFISFVFYSSFSNSICHILCYFSVYLWSFITTMFISKRLKGTASTKKSGFHLKEWFPLKRTVSSKKERLPLRWMIFPKMNSFTKRNGVY